MKWRVLISAPYMLPVLPEYEPILTANGIEVVAPPVRERLDERDLQKWLPDIDGVICGDDCFTEAVFRKFPRLKVISKWGTGIDSIDSEAASRLGIRVYNTRGAFTEPVADSVMAYVLAFARRLFWMDQAMRAGRWEKISGVSLRECVLGIIGVGSIGRAVVTRAQAFGMTVIGNDLVLPPATFVSETGLSMVSMEMLLSTSDFVSLNCDLNPTSYHLIGEHELRRMKPTAYLINTSRGAVVDEIALVRALLDKQISGAGLDVFEEEPLPEESPLRKLDTCLLAPHNANQSPAAAKRVHQNTVHNLIEGLRADRS